MKIYDIDILLKQEGQTGLYDLTARTYIPYQVVFLEYTVQPDEEMRIDLISFRIYQTTEFADLLLSVNEIISPLNIRSGDILRYPESGGTNYFRVTPTPPASQRASLVNVARANIKDPRRLEFLENNLQLPPTQLAVPQSPIIVNSNNITIVPIT